MIKFLKKIIPEKYHNNKFIVNINERFRDIYMNKSYSQEAEDLILKRFFERQETGFYIDVGAHHPKRFSNTYLFYKMGWTGINIDAMPGSMKKFRKYRSRDINIEALVSNKITEVDYFSFTESALNTTDTLLAEERKKISTLMKKHILKTKSLTKILDENLPKDKKINFLTIDVEGADFEVIKSNNWQKYKPQIVLTEIRNSNLNDIMENEVTVFLKDLGYVIFAKTVNTVFFKLTQ